MAAKADLRISPRGIGGTTGDTAVDIDAVGDIKVMIQEGGGVGGIDQRGRTSLINGRVLGKIEVLDLEAGGSEQRVQALEKLNQFGIGATPGPFVKKLLGKHAVDKSYTKLSTSPEKSASTADGETEGEKAPIQQSMLNDEDFLQRLSRVQDLDKSCQDVFEQAITGNVGGDLKAMVILPGEKELVSIPVVAMMGAPFKDGKTEVLGQGVVILTEGADKRHRLIFIMVTDSREIHATEKWSLSDHKGTKRVAGDGEYLVSRGQERFLGFFNVEGGLFDVQVEARDEAILKALFSADETSSKEREKRSNKSCCSCLWTCMGCPKRCVNKCCSCVKGCCSCFKGCCSEGGKCSCFKCCCSCSCCKSSTPASEPDVSVDQAGSWDFSAEFSANLKDLIEAKIQTITNDASYKFPNCPSLTNPEDRAVLVEFTRCVNLKYRNSSTNKIQQCTLVVQPQVAYSQIAAFASMLSVHTIRGGENGEEKIVKMPQMPVMQMPEFSSSLLSCCKKKRRSLGGQSSQKGRCSTIRGLFCPSRRRK